MRGVHQVIPIEKEWLSVLTAINASGSNIPNYYIFKGVRKVKNYIAFCEEEALMGMQKKGIDRYLSFLGIDGSFYPQI